MMDKKSLYDEDVKILKEWYSKQPHFPQDNKIDENLLYTFVSGTKSLEIAKSKVDAYLSMRNDVFSLFKNGPTTNKFRDIYRKVGLVVLPGTTEEGWKVTFATFGKYGETCSDDIFTSYLALFEAMLLLDPMGTDIMSVVDFQYSTPSIAAFSFTKFSAYVKHLMNTLPLKYKRSVLLNTPYFMDKGLAITTNFMPKKISERIISYRDSSRLKDHLPEKMIPSDYGGKGPSTDELIENWLDIMESKKEWFEKQAKLVCDESKRPKDAYRKEGLDFGVDGSFKSLNID